MKLSKLGFTMAELLLCIAIIGIVSAMGMTITKKGTEKAYNLFYYTGYINMYNAIADAVATGEASLSYAYNADGSINDTVKPKIVKHIAKCFNIEENDIIQDVYLDYTLNTANGIRYIIHCFANNSMSIYMIVPTNVGSSKRVLLYYFPQNDVQYRAELIPGIIENSDYFSILNRKDLLPAYVDDGKVGRNNAINRTNWQYQRPIYGSYKDAFCSVYGNSVKVPIVELDCSTGFTNISAGRTGVIKIADPRKAK